MYHLEDVKSDLSVFHRIDDIEEIPADSFFPKVRRLISYKGAVRLTAERVAEENKNKPEIRETTKEWQARRKAGTPTGSQSESTPGRIDKHYTKIEQNTEIFELGLIEAAKG